MALAWAPCAGPEMMLCNLVDWIPHDTKDHLNALPRASGDPWSHATGRWWWREGVWAEGAVVLWCCVRWWSRGQGSKPLLPWAVSQGQALWPGWAFSGGRARACGPGLSCLPSPLLHANKAESDPPLLECEAPQANGDCWRNTRSVICIQWHLTGGIG